MGLRGGRRGAAGHGTAPRGRAGAAAGGAKAVRPRGGHRALRRGGPRRSSGPVPPRGRGGAGGAAPPRAGRAERALGAGARRRSRHAGAAAPGAAAAGVGRGARRRHGKARPERTGRERGRSAGLRCAARAEPREPRAGIGGASGAREGAPRARLGRRTARVPAVRQRLRCAGRLPTQSSGAPSPARRRAPRPPPAQLRASGRAASCRAPEDGERRGSPAEPRNPPAEIASWRTLPGARCRTSPFHQTAQIRRSCERFCVGPRNASSAGKVPRLTARTRHGEAGLRPPHGTAGCPPASAAAPALSR